MITDAVYEIPCTLVLSHLAGTSAKSGKAYEFNVLEVHGEIAEGPFKKAFVLHLDKQDKNVPIVTALMEMLADSDPDIVR